MRILALCRTQVDKLQARLIAGRIIPALATTTSMVTGFVCIELIKYLQDPEKNFKDLQVRRQASSGARASVCAYVHMCV